MPAIYHRKLMKHGQSSRVVALPPEWLEFNGLKDGGEVTILLVNNEVHISIHQNPKSEKRLKTQ